jgi:hypothetical protein
MISMSGGSGGRARVDDDPCRLRPCHPPHGELGVVGKRRAHPDHHGIDEGTQPVQVGEAGRAVDVVRMAGRGRDTAVERLANLADHDQIVDAARAERSEQSFPRRRQWIGRGAKRFRNAAPPGRVAGRRVRSLTLHAFWFFRRQWNLYRRNKFLS